MSKHRCAGKTKAGKPCRGYPVQGSAYCQSHDPELAAERAAWRSAGGRARATPEGAPIDLLSPEDIRTGLGAAIGSTWMLQNSCERSRALCQLYLASLRTFESIDFGERIEALEKRLEVLSGHQTEAQDS